MITGARRFCTPKVGVQFPPHPPSTMGYRQTRLCRSTSTRPTVELSEAAYRNLSACAHLNQTHLQPIERGQKACWRSWYDHKRRSASARDTRDHRNGLQDHGRATRNRPSHADVMGKGARNATAGQPRRPCSGVSGARNRLHTIRISIPDGRLHAVQTGELKCQKSP